MRRKLPIFIIGGTVASNNQRTFQSDDFFRYFSFMKKKTYGSLVTKPFYLNTSFTYESCFGYILMNNEGKITK